MRGRHPLALLALFLAMAAAPAHAAELSWRGTLGFHFLNASLPSLRAVGSGVATVNDSAGGPHLSALRLARGLSGSSAIPVTDPEVTVAGLVGAVANARLATGTLRSTTSTSPAALAGAIPVRGFVGVCLFDPNCLPGGFIALPLSQPGRGAALGVGGLLTAGGAGAIRISALAAPWTSGTTLLTATTSGGETFSLPLAGSAHGALSFTTSTALPGGAFSVVTPLRVISSNGSAFDLFARLSVRFVPEPRVELLLAAGVLALIAIGRRHMRR